VLYPVELLVRKATANLNISIQLQNSFLESELVFLQQIRDMKKVLRITAVVFGVFFLALVLGPMLFKSKIEAAVKEKINEQVNAEVDWTKFGLTFFRGFPNLSVNLHQLSVVGQDAYEGDTLAGIMRFELRVNPFSAIRKDIQVKSIMLDRPLINGIVLEDETPNWDIAMGKEDAEGEELEDVQDAGDTSMSVSLKRLAIREGRIYYADRSSGIEASLEGFDLQLRGDLSMEETQLRVSSGTKKVNVKMAGIPYLKDAILDLDLVAAANLLENRYVLEENLLSLNGLHLGAEGAVTLLENGAMDMDIHLFSRETSFKTLLSLVPAIYMQDFENLDARGTMQLDARIAGIMKDSVLPDASLNLLVEDGYFAYPELPKDVSDVQIAVNLEYRGEDMDGSLVEVEQFRFLLGGNPFELSMRVDHPVSDMHVSGMAEGTIDFATLKDVLPMEDVLMEGRLETMLSWDVLMSQIEQEQYEEVVLEGSLLAENVHLAAPDIPVPVTLEKVYMLFNPRFVELSDFNLKMGSSDLHLKGELENFIPYVFDEQTVSGRLALTSMLVDANEFLTEEDRKEREADRDSIVPVPPDSLAQPLGLRIPENLDFVLDVDMQRIEYCKLVMENIEAKFRVVGGVAGIENLQMDAIDGSITSTGWVDTRGEFAEVDFDLDMRGMDIPSAYDCVVSLKKMVPMAKYCRGKANIQMQYHSLMDNTFTPLYESIDAKGDAFTKGLQFYNLDEFVPISQLLANEKFTKMAPDEVDVGFTVRDGRIIFNPFDWKIDDSEFAVSGSHGIDLSMDYKIDMNIAKADLGAAANELIQGLTLLAAGAGISLPQSDHIKVTGALGGTFNRPRFTTDLSANLRSSGEQVQAAVEERISEEVEKAEEQVRQEASEQAEKIIADAETEAARLLEEARKAGDALVREAELQGEKLMDEAGSNPLKQVAARTAANELKRQAQVQSENLITEAEKKGEELVQKAREEAEQL
jgi:hypothetical protein